MCKNFYCRKSPIFLDVDIEKVLVSSKVSSGEKNYNYFIGYLYNGHIVKPLQQARKMNKLNRCIF